MATPQVTGAFSVLSAAFPGMTATDILGRLKATGVQVTDTRPPNPSGAFVGHTKPRIQLDEAVNFAVGGIAEFPLLAETSAESSAAPADGSTWSASAYAALAGGLAAAVVALGGAAWYGRRRWLR
jgi:hypothetical protein